MRGIKITKKQEEEMIESYYSEESDIYSKVLHEAMDIAHEVGILSKRYSSDYNIEAYSVEYSSRSKVLLGLVSYILGNWGYTTRVESRCSLKSNSDEIRFALMRVLIVEGTNDKVQIASPNPRYKRKDAYRKTLNNGKK